MNKELILWKIRHWTKPKTIKSWLGFQLGKWLPKVFPHVMTARGELRAIKNKYLFKDGLAIDFGVISHRKVTNDFAGLIVDRLHTGGTDFENAVFAYHGAGTDGTAESSGDTALGSEVLRSTGTSTEASAQVYQSIATLTFTSSNGIQEHGLFNGDTSLARIMMDRSVFTEIGVNSSDQIEFTYQLTVESGG